MRGSENIPGVFSSYILTAGKPSINDLITDLEIATVRDRNPRTKTPSSFLNSSRIHMTAVPPPCPLIHDVLHHPSILLPFVASKKSPGRILPTEFEGYVERYNICHLQQEIAQKQGLPRYMHLILEDYVSIRRQYNALSPAEDRYTDTDRFRSMIGRARNAAEKVQEKECNIIAYRQIPSVPGPEGSPAGMAIYTKHTISIGPDPATQVEIRLYHMAHDFRLLCQGRPTVDISHVISRDKSKPLYASACLAFYIYWTRTF